MEEPRVKALTVSDEYGVACFFVPNETFRELVQKMALDSKDVATICWRSSSGTRLHISPETSPDGSKIYYDPKEEQPNADSPTD